MNLNRPVAMLLALSMLVATPACIVVTPEPVTSSVWILDVCRAISRFTATVRDHAAGFSDLFVGASGPEDVSLSAIYEVPAEASEDVVAALVAVEPRVPEADLEAYQIFRALFATNAAVYRGVVETLEAFDLDVGDGAFDQDALDTWTSQINASMEPILQQIAELELELQNYDWESLSPETLELASDCEIAPVPTCPDASNPICTRTGTTIGAGEPWLDVLAEDADPEARDIAGIGIFEADFSGDGWVHTGFSGPDESMLAFAIQGMAASCVDPSTSAASLPEFDAPVRTGMGLIERPSHGPLGMLVYTTDEFATAAHAAATVTALEAALARCGHELSAMPPLVADLTIEPAGILNVFSDSPFGDYFPNAPTDAMSHVYLADGPFVTLLMSDPYGIAEPIVDAAADLLGQRLQSAASSRENR